jgi:hypothetical protein
MFPLDIIPSIFLISLYFVMHKGKGLFIYFLFSHVIGLEREKCHKTSTRKEEMQL